MHFYAFIFLKNGQMFKKPHKLFKILSACGARNVLFCVKKYPPFAGGPAISALILMSHFFELLVFQTIFLACLSYSI